MATKKSTPKKRTRTAAGKVTVRDLAPRKRKGNVKGGLEHVAVNFSKMAPSNPRG